MSQHFLTKPERIAMIACRGVAAWGSRVWAAHRTNPAVRERTSALAAFGFIFAFGLFSFDYVITGGPDWNPGASAAPLEHARLRSQPLAAAPYEAPPPLPEFDLAAHAPEGPVGELLGGPDTLLPNAQLELAETQTAQMMPASVTVAIVHKRKAGGA